MSNNALAERALEHHPDSEHHNGYQDAIREYMEGTGLASASEAGIGREAAFSIAERYMDNRAAGMDPVAALKEAFAAADPQISAAKVRDLYYKARAQIIAGIAMMAIGGIIMPTNFGVGFIAFDFGAVGFARGVHTANFARDIDLALFEGTVLASLDPITQDIIKGVLLGR